MSDNHSLGVRADLTHQMKGKNQVIYDEDVFENDALIDHLYSHQTSKESKPLGWLVNTYYNGKVGELGIDFNFDYMTSGTDTNRENVEQSQVNDDFVLSKSGTNSRLYATKLVLSYPLWKGSIEAGTEMTFAKRHNTYWIDKVTIANTDADIKENNIAAFAEYGCDFGQYGNASVGLRYEHTLYDYDDTQNQNFLHRSMDEWFPTAAYSISLGKVQAALSYSIKTERPSFFAMNDAVTYISRYTLQAGNSQLLNERLPPTSTPRTPSPNGHTSALRSRMLLLSNTLTSTNLSIRSVPISLSHLVSASGRSMPRQALRSRTFTSTSQVQAGVASGWVAQVLASAR